MDALSIGKAGEYLVCFDLITKGFTCFPSEQGLQFDLVVVDEEKKMHKIQVKTTLKSKNNKYVYHIRHGKGGQRGMYKSDDVDIIAFVSIEEKKVAYLHLSECKSILTLYKESNRGNNPSEILEINMNKAISEVKNGAKDLEFLCEKYDLSIHTLRRYQHKDRFFNKYNMVYFEDLSIFNILKRII